MNDDLKARTLKVLDELSMNGLDQSKVTALVRELLAEVDALGKDARRYQWLRQNLRVYENDDGDGRTKFMHEEHFSISAETHVDEAIDAALSQGEPRG